MSDEEATKEYQDDDFVYVDPEKRKVMGYVEWIAEGKAKPLYKEDDEEQNVNTDKKGKPRRKKKRALPWGTFRSMKKLHRIGGKEKEAEKYITLDEAMKKSETEAYWDN